jgi:hypothetical protein
MRKILLTAAGLLGASIATAQAQSSDTILDRINQKKQISIGYREASIRFSFLNDERKAVAYALDICSKVVDAVKQKLELSDLAFNFVAVNPQNRIAFVVNGTVDIECGSTVNTSPGSRKPISQLLVRSVRPICQPYPPKPALQLEAEMGEVIRFIPRAEHERLRLMREARANYDSVFPSANSVDEQRDSAPPVHSVDGTWIHRGVDVFS